MSAGLLPKIDLSNIVRVSNLSRLCRYQYWLTWGGSCRRSCFKQDSRKIILDLRSPHNLLDNLLALQMTSYYHFNEQVFRSDVAKALNGIERILEVYRHPQLAEDVDHEYINKYELANHLVNTAIIAQMNCLERMGLTSEVLKEMDPTKSATLRFQALEKCNFLKEQLVDVPSEDSYVEEKSSRTLLGQTRFSNSKKSVFKRVKKVKEYHWTVDMHWDISVFSGTDVDKAKVLKSRDSSTVVVTQSNEAPLAEAVSHPNADLSLTWLLKQIDVENAATNFTIAIDKAKTPRRNEQVDAAMSFFCSQLAPWVHKIKYHFSQLLHRTVTLKHNPAVPEPTNPPSLVDSCSASELFHPIVPLLEDNSADSEASNDKEVTQPKSSFTLTDASSSLGASDSKALLLSGDDNIKLLNEQVRSLEEKLESFQKTFPPAHLVKMHSIAEARLFLLCDHSEKLCLQLQYSMEYMEKMLEEQLVAAVGKRVSTADLEQFVRFHNAKFLSLPPRPFCHAIGRPNHSPYGVLSIESQGEGESFESIETLVREVGSPSSLKIPLNAATTLELTGKTYLHGWMNHRSQTASHNSYQLSARARQFSSFLLVIGTMAGSDQLKPKDAIILQNKDEVIIELLLEELPSAKQFKDAVRSLSPEQQRFAKSFRSMQLESSVFGVCVIQVKPQLELLLGLPEDSLAKEIKLTEDLMQLFVEYQIPADLLSYDGEDNSTVTTRSKVENVREHVKAVLSVIDESKEKQLEEEIMKADMEKARNVRLEDESESDGDSLGLGDQEGFLRAASEVEEAYCDDDMDMAMAFSVRDMDGCQEECDEPVMDEAPVRKPAPRTPKKDEADQSQPDQSTASRPATNNSSAVNFTLMPKLLDASIEKYDKDSALRSTKLKASDCWTRTRQENLLTKASKTT
eukprot:scaffold8569_cov139-Cylindrotheca_fusiformis.AAC.19